MALAPLSLSLLLAALAVIADADDGCARIPGPQSTAERLKQQLLSYYVADEMPSAPFGGSLGIENILLIKHVEGVYYNTAEIQITFVVMWDDTRLAWNPAQYDHLSNIFIEPSSIWVPFIGFQSHSTTSPDAVDLHGRMCLVLFSGKVTCVLGLSVSTHCLSDYRAWPQDVHNCSFHIGSWELTSRQVFFDRVHVIIEVPDDATWVVKQHGDAISNSSLGPDGRERSRTHVWMVLVHQEAVIAVAIYGAPLALTLMTLSSLALPAACGERLALVSISILGHCMTLAYCSWWLEGGASAPRIVVFHRDGVCAAAAALLLMTWAGRLQSSRRSAPAWLVASLACLRTSPAGVLLLPPPAQQPADKPAESTAANATSVTEGDAESPSAGDAQSGGNDALVVSETAAATPTAPDAAPDADCWRAASDLLERLGKASVCAALVAAVVRLLLQV